MGSQFLKNAFSALPTVASSKLALVGYVVIVLSWFLLALKVRRNKNLLQHLHQLPDSDRLKALELEMGVVRVKGGLSAEQWLRSRTHQYYFMAFAIVCCVAVMIFAIASATNPPIVKTASLPSAVEVTRREMPASISIVDASIDQPSDGFPLLDIKVRNIGQQVAFLKKAIFHVTELFNLEDPYFYSETHVDVSWNYNVTLPLRKAPYSREATLSQAVRPNDVDRFTFSLGHGRRTHNNFWLPPDALYGESKKATDATQPSKPPAKVPAETDDDELSFFSEPASSIIRMSVEIIYNEDDQQVSTGALLFLMPTPKHFLMAIGHAKSNAKEIVEQNRRYILAASKLQAKVSPTALELFKKVH